MGLLPVTTASTFLFQPLGFLPAEGPGWEGAGRPREAKGEPCCPGQPEKGKVRAETRVFAFALKTAGGFDPLTAIPRRPNGDSGAGLGLWNWVRESLGVTLPQR